LDGVNARTRLIAGAAALAYVVAAAVENMGVLDTPLLGASSAEVHAAHADRALLVVTSVAGLLALASYVVFALAVRPRWTGVAVAGALLAAAGVVLGLDADLFEWQLRLRFVAGVCMALFLVAAAQAMPATLRVLGRAIAVPLALAPVALTGGHAVQVLAAIAFSAHALWIWLAALWLLYGDAARAELARRAAFLMLVVAAGMVGVALLVVPGATGSFFAWSLKPEPLAAFAGGVYVGSAAVYAAGIRLGPRASRPLVVAAVVLSVSVLFWTLVHLEVFDLGRLQAWAWLALFGGFALVTAALALRGGGPDPVASAPLSPPVRLTLTLVTVALAAAGLALWADPVALGLPPLGGRFAGSWTVMLAVLSGWAAVRNGRDEARLSALALIALPLGALVAAARTGVGEPLYLAGLALLCLAGLAVFPRLRNVELPDVPAAAAVDTRGNLLV
jgi:hypothetical protein